MRPPRSCVVDRRRPCRLGSFAYADSEGVRGRHGIVRLSNSSICGGRGLFATRFIPLGTPITRYYGTMRKNVDGLPSSRLAYTFMCRSGRHIVGCADPPPGCGLGQLANDAVHEELTGRRNNAEFAEHAGRVYLVACHDIEPGEEVLVDYHISYWIAFADDADVVSDGRLREWAAAQGRVQQGLRDALGGFCTLEAYHGLAPDPDLNLNDDDHCACIARYTLRLGPAAKAALAENPRCGCDSKGRGVRSVEVRLVRRRDSCGGDTTDMAWRCAHCAPAFEPVAPAAD